MTKTIDNKGSAIEFAYDALGRLKTKKFPTGRTIEYLYDLTNDDNPIHTNCLGRLSTYRDASGLTMLGYNAMGRIKAVQQEGFAPVTYSYDWNGQPTALTYPILLEKIVLDYLWQT